MVDNLTMQDFRNSFTSCIEGILTEENHDLTNIYIFLVIAMGFIIIMIFLKKWFETRANNKELVKTIRELVTRIQIVENDNRELKNRMQNIENDNGELKIGMQNIQCLEEKIQNIEDGNRELRNRTQNIENDNGELKIRTQNIESLEKKVQNIHYPVQETFTE